MGLVDKIKNPKNFVPEVSNSVFSYGAVGLGTVVSNYFGLNDIDNSTLIGGFKAAGSFVGKVGGVSFCHRDLIDENFEEFSSLIKKSSTIMVPYLAINSVVNSLTLFSLQH